MTFALPGLTMKSDPNSSDFRVTLLGTGTPRLEIDRYGRGTMMEVGGETLIFDSGRCTLSVPIGIGRIRHNSWGSF